VEKIVLTPWDLTEGFLSLFLVLLNRRSNDHGSEGQWVVHMGVKDRSDVLGPVLGHTEVGLYRT
jgi:hypothetical protein